eukprot:gene27876-11988_t
MNTWDLGAWGATMGSDLGTRDLGRCRPMGAAMLNLTHYMLQGLAPPGSPNYRPAADMPVAQNRLWLGPFMPSLVILGPSLVRR